ncbi:orotidine-5'-phosphate decarboxylase [[Collinsella] massiliensis]|mgnify:CR=1 FL=1|uniref:Orotidine 5'-phosphate decarboxylase n=1 Tax=[Collinsella] massiliensis TaxID=1232426 RepID=A0A1Y3XVR7_9ACTN|nr:orotidine-5'-phosphate decarboxylase [[Collinsella] massiliensis]OUN89211.1 orotidine-5'-phosphate decarboxylase [[Collinsella] massiliensis]
MLEQEARERIIVALDCGREEALALAQALSGHARWLKVGMTLYYAEGPSIVRAFRDLGFKVFLDLKLHDIPHQVRGAARSAALAGADLLSVHGLGSGAMLAAAREGVEQAAAETGGERARLVAITVLTSMDEQALAEVGITCPIPEEAARLAGLARANGIDGIVCSPQEAAAMRQLLGEDALIVTPGVRPAGAALGDQSRVATPASAIASGASHLVIGRPITGADDPVAAYEAIVDELTA